MKTLSLLLLAAVLSITPVSAVTITASPSTPTLDPLGLNSEIITLDLDNSAEPMLWIVITSILTDLLPPGLTASDAGALIPIQLGYSVAPNAINLGIFATQLFVDLSALNGLYNLSLVVTYELYDQDPFDAFGDPSGVLSIGGDTVFVPIDVEIVNATTAVPEPSTMWLCGGLLTAWALRRCRHRAVR